MAEKNYGQRDQNDSNPKSKSGGTFGQSATADGDNRSQGLADTAKDLASQAGEKLLDVAETEKTVGADFVGGMATAIRRAANEFDEDVPQAAPYIRGAADRLDYFAQVVRRRDVKQLVADAQDFARHQPTAFLGATFLAGFFMVRFLKSSTGTQGHAARSNNSGSRQ